MSSAPTCVCHRCGYLDEAGTAAPGSRCPKDGLALITLDDHRKAEADPLLGRVIGGKYPVLGLIGAGGMGAVYRAIQEPVGREVAVKVIRRLAGQDEEWVSQLRGRFFREAKIIARLSSPSAVALHDYGEEADGVLYMVLEMLRGRSLYEVIRAEAPMEPARAVRISCQILSALSEAHALGLVHRDLKPENVMLVRGSWGGELAKVLDFGIAKMLHAEDGPVGPRTHVGTVLGTPLYMAPEQAQAKGSDARSDLYSVGVIAYEMLTGKPPFHSMPPFDVMRAHRDAPVPPMPATLGAPPALETAILKALQKKPENRYASAEEMAGALSGTEGLASPDRAGVSTDAAASGDDKAPTLLEHPAVPANPFLDVLRERVGDDFVAHAATTMDSRPAQKPTVAPTRSDPRAGRRNGMLLGVLAALAVVLAAAALLAPGLSSRERRNESPSAAPPLGAAPPAAPGALGFAPAPPPATPAPPSPVVPPPPAPVAPGPTATGPEPELVKPVPLAGSREAEPPRARRPGPDARRTTVSINSTPWAEVSIDGKSSGQTPIKSLPIEPGRHVLVLRNPLLKLEKRIIARIKAGEENVIPVDLQAPGGGTP